jgi:hypothetical protein
MSKNIEEKFKELEDRNKRVELDKAWETSFVRRGFIALVTYLIAFWFMWSIGVSDSYLNALVPTGGYMLSTLSLPFLKRWWLKYQ